MERPNLHNDKESSVQGTGARVTLLQLAFLWT